MRLTTSEIADLFWSQCWQLTVLIVFVAFLGATLLRRRSHLLHLLWVIVFLKSLTLPLWSSPTGVFSWLQTSNSVADRFDYGYITPAPSPRVAAPPEQGSRLAGEWDSKPTGPPVSTLNLVGLAIGIWAVGVLLLLSWALRRWIEVYRLLNRRSRPADQILNDYARRLAKRLKMNARVRVLVSAANLVPDGLWLVSPCVGLAGGTDGVKIGQPTPADRGS